MARGKIGSRRLPASLPSVVFALSFVVLGWIASHSISYALVDLVSHGHGEEHVHGYMGVLKLAGGIGLVLAFGLALRAFFHHGSFGEWLREGGVSGTRKQAALATALPAAVFVLVEHLERFVAGTGTHPPARLLAVGILVQLAVGLLCLALVRVAFRVTEIVIHSIVRRRLVRPVRRTTVPVVEGVPFVRPPCPMAGSAAGRAPPADLVSPKFPLLPPP